VPIVRPDFPDDTQRPAYHFVAPRNWLNDPNGNFYWDGTYHLFYQYRDVPHNEGTDGFGIWAHAATENFIDWVDYPHAFIGNPDGPDYVGCWSGGHILHGGTHYLVYWGNRGGMCMGTSSDGFRTWQKHERYPFIAAPTEDDEWFLHDPTLWHDGDWIYLCSGWQIGEARGIGTSKDAGFMFRSRNMLDWEYTGLFYEPGEESDLAVPDFFPFGDTHMLLFASHTRGAQYYLGSYTDGKFTPEQHGRINYTICDPDPGMQISGDLIAPRSWETPDGRRIMIAWIAEGRDSEAMKTAGWSGIMSIPRVLWMGDDGTVRTGPARELEALRGEHVGLAAQSTDGAELTIEGVAGDRLELVAEIDCGSARQVGLKFRCSPDGSEQTVVTIDRDTREAVLDVASSSADDSLTGLLPQQAAYAPDGGTVQLRAFLDASVIEVFVDDRLCLTKRIYPTRADSSGVRFFAAGGKASLRRFDCWQMGVSTYTSFDQAAE